jgi:hypothetical protein
MKSLIFSFLLVVTLIFLITNSIPLVSSQDLEGNRFYQDNGISLGIKEPGELKVGENHTFSVHLYNSTTGAPLAIGQAYCAFHLYNSTNGAHIIINNNISFGSTSYDYFITINGLTNFTQPGVYPYVVACIGNSNVESGVYSSQFIVTTTGIGSNYTIPIFLLVVSTIFLILAFMFKNPPIAFISGILYAIIGMYLMIYGFGNISNFYTQALSLIVLSFGLIIMLISVLSWFDDDEGEYTEE